MDVPNKLYLQIEDAEGEALYDVKTPLNGSAYTHCFERINDSDIVYRREPGWTRVEDGLPDDGAGVWIAFAGKEKKPIALMAYYTDGLWIEDCILDPYTYKNVTHWMPRQERPKLPEVNDG